VIRGTGVPSVSVCIPTFNRHAGLERAVASALAQTHDDLEVVVSDNASRDATPAVLQALVQRDARVRFVRQERNLGPIGNFNAVLREARGEHVLMLADDDWLDADYVECCLAVLRGRPDVALATGATRYYEGEEPPDLVLNTTLTSPSPARRLLRYLRHSWASAAFYGVIRRDAVEPALPIPNVMGADWLFVSAVAFAGKVVTVPETYLNRARGGASVSYARIAEVSGLPRWQGRHPTLAIACFQALDVASRSRAYEGLGRPRRVALGVLAFGTIVRAHAFDLVWDTVSPWVLHPAVAPVTSPLRDWARGHRARYRNRRDQLSAPRLAA